MTATAALSVGQIAPEFRLRGPGGQFVTLSEYRGRKHVVVAFFPLAFSPVCSHQLPDLEKDARRIEALDGVVLGISVDSYYANEAFARSLGLSFPLLSDFDRSVSEKWGMLIRERLYSQRALFIVDKQGRIAYADVAPTTSEVPSKTALIEALERLR
jgi:peroxiredoxin (alkyl hydroperoxide reductase subunit C)